MRKRFGPQAEDVERRLEQRAEEKVEDEDADEEEDREETPPVPAKGRRALVVASAERRTREDESAGLGRVLRRRGAAEAMGEEGEGRWAGFGKGGRKRGRGERYPLQPAR